MYYHYFGQNHLIAIHDLQVALSQLQNNQTEIKSQTAILKKLQN